MLLFEHDRKVFCTSPPFFPLIQGSALCSPRLSSDCYLPFKDLIRTTDASHHFCNLEREYEFVFKTPLPSLLLLLLLFASFKIPFPLVQAARQNDYHLETRRGGGQHGTSRFWPQIGHQLARGQRQWLLRVRGVTPRQQRPLSHRWRLPACSR